MVYIASMDENYQGTLYGFGLPDDTQVKRIAASPRLAPRMPQHDSTAKASTVLPD